jgi:phosphatidylserine decarboxylase
VKFRVSFSDRQPRDGLYGVQLEGFDPPGYHGSIYFSTMSANPPHTPTAATLWKDLLQGYSQHVYPHHVMSLLMYVVARCRYNWFKKRLIAWFVRRYQVDMSEAAEPSLESYKHFNAFFTRALKDGSRIAPRSDDLVLCPADGKISQIGTINRDSVLQAKGKYYSVVDLVGGERNDARPFENGQFATVYLSPRDYHRIHMPIAGRLCKMVYVPGRLFSVNDLTTRVIPRVFTRNERLVMTFHTTLGPMLIIMVGAIFVGSMETVWQGRITPPYRRKPTTWHYEGSECVFQQGEEIARFNMGSTVILAHPPGSVRWVQDVVPNSAVQVQQELGRQL